MNIRKIIIGAFLPKRFKMKKIEQINPSEKYVEQAVRGVAKINEKALIQGADANKSRMVITERLFSDTPIPVRNPISPEQMEALRRISSGARLNGINY